MAADKILVAYDESEGGKRALEMAASIVEPNPQGELDVLYVAPIPVMDQDMLDNLQNLIDMVHDRGEAILSEAVESLSETVANRTNALLAQGQAPAAEIIGAIEQGDYDMVVIGSRGLSGLKGYMGSVSHKVLHASAIPVLVVK